jgi:hypothetical protein
MGTIVGLAALMPAADEAGAFERVEVFRYGRLGYAGGLSEDVYSELTITAEALEDAAAGRVRECLEDGRGVSWHSSCKTFLHLKDEKTITKWLWFVNGLVYSE